MKSTHGWIGLYFLTSLLLLLLGCADEMPPPGGEIDKTGPYLLGSEPLTGAVNVPAGNSVTLYFNERVKKPKTGQAIFISPRPITPPKIKWSNDRITITLADSFKTNQTYIISAGSLVKDYRGNQVDTGLTVAFSTGSIIAEGRTAGLITDDKGTPRGGLLVGLFDPIALETADVVDSVYPSYVIPTNAEGLFSIGYLPDAEFCMIAFDDKNKNGRFNPPKESYALPDRSIVIGGDSPIEDLMLTVQVDDTTSPEILAASQTSDGLLRLRLSRAIDLKQLHENPDRCVLISVDSSRMIPARALLENAEAHESAINFVTGPLEEGEYSVSLTYDGARSPISFSGVEIAPTKDETPPTLIQIRPESQPVFAEDALIDLTFSEPLDTSLFTAETFLLKHVSDTAIPVTPSWLDPLRLRLTPQTLLTGGRYRLDITEFELADIAGNRLGDSARVHFFNVIDADSLGSISGQTIVALVGKENDLVRMTFQKVGGRTFDLTATPGAFRIELPGGRYLLSGFVDSDGDSVKSPGSFRPYLPAETMAIYPDTIAVRARFETAEIQFEFR